MRLLLLTNSYPSVASPSGAPYITARVRELRRAGVDVTAVALVPRYRGAAAVARRLTGRGHADEVRMYPYAVGLVECDVRWGAMDIADARRGRPMTRLVSRAAARVHDLVGDRTYDLVHAHGMYTLPAGAVGALVAQRIGAPVVVSLHGGDVTEIMPRTPMTHARTLDRAAATIYVSEALRRRAVALGAPTQRSHVIPNGVDRAVFTPETSAERRRSQAPRLLFVGNLLPVKGVDRLMPILTAVRRRHPDATLDVLGSGDGGRELDGAPGVVLHGRVSPQEVAQQMRRASVLLVPSRSEGWGCVASEAYACGTPVVASAVDGLRESVLADGQVETGDAPGSPSVGITDLAERFADAIDRVLSGPALPSLGSTAAPRGWDEVVRTELDVLTGVLGKAGA